MAHSMRLKVVTGGVETAEQFEILYSTGCDEVQGFFFSEPLPVESFHTYCGTV
ncbi:MAG: EAL domain-containing protein [Alphaproteobacteria bacterium]|uniref:EAL domain-containing protein n=1 Tax=Candidatus Nitrobium versatile TaxID=2884831 RepID=A0A953M3B6_9BACT|nr:EAL domain-containing protein [Candidatus Nitrobium versatile]